MRPRFLAAALGEVDDAVAYLDEQRPGLGERFERDLESTIALIAQHPFTGKRLTAHVRKFGLNKFKYNVIYSVDGDDLLMIAIAHHRRRPAYWANRITGRE